MGVHSFALSGGRLSVDLLPVLITFHWSSLIRRSQFMKKYSKNISKFWMVAQVCNVHTLQRQEEQPKPITSPDYRKSSRVV